MKALLLAAGRGERMRPLTDDCPKPLLEVHGKALIDWHLEALARGGVRQVVVNTAWQEDRLIAALGDGQRFGLHIAYSMEGRDHGGALETGGGLKKALPLLLAGGAASLDTPVVGAAPAHQAGGGDSFWYVAADVFAPTFVFDPQAVARFEAGVELARLWMVANPAHHPLGDFGIEGGRATAGADGTRLTWTGIGLFRPAFVTELMADLAPGTKSRLRPFLDIAIERRRLGAQAYMGAWTDVGTPERLAALQRR